MKIYIILLILLFEDRDDKIYENKMADVNP